jgi:hypothetical protein
MHAHNQHARLQRKVRTKKPWRTCSGPVTADAAAVASAAAAAREVRGAVTMHAALHRSQEAAAHNACPCGLERVVRAAVFSPAPVAGHQTTTKSAAILIMRTCRARARDPPPCPFLGWTLAARLLESAHTGPARASVQHRKRGTPTRGASNARRGTSGCGNAAANADRAHAEHAHSSKERRGSIRFVRVQVGRVRGHEFASKRAPWMHGYDLAM